ncbi:MAG TPA: hypothetical protein IAC09_06485 [Candidatus Cryptobacteroides intestinipullorum]|nr:hypothetical protein [Candidatus Cryptobacteroides intestinipullorum]
MKNDEIKMTGHYESPVFDCITMAAEKGFAASGGEVEEMGLGAPDYVDGFNF